MNKTLPIVEIYTDGACSGNPGPGGWGAILISGQHEKVISGGEAQTTNNRMEMKAVVEALKSLKKPCVVNIYSDSALIINAMNKGWIDNWQKRDWKKADKKPVENKDLWQEMLLAMQPHQLKWIKVKGHSGHPLNERVDDIAVEAAQKFK